MILFWLGVVVGVMFMIGVLAIMMVIGGSRR